MKKLTCLPLIILLGAVTIGRAAITDGLVSYWPLDVNDGTTTPDLSFGNTMTVAGAPVVGPGQFSNAFSFSGTTPYLTNLHDFDNSGTGLPIFRSRTYTVSMWVKGAAQTARFLFSHGNTGTTTPIFLIQTGNAAANNSKLDIILRTDGNVAVISHVVSTNVVFDNTWHHIAWVDDRGTAKLYVDGNLDAANFNYDKTFIDFSFNTTAIATLARTTVSTGSIFTGAIDEVAVWERALSQSEVNQVRTNGVYTPGVSVPARPATLVREPVSVTKKQGDWQLLSVQATGNRPLSYQWSKNGSPLIDGTAATYFLSNLQTNNSGDFYSVSVTNMQTITAATSSNAILTVVEDAAPGLTNGLVNYWPLDVYDELTNSPEMHFGHKMVMRGYFDTNSGAIIAGQFSNAANFLVTADATNIMFGIRSNGQAIFSRTNYSVSLWVKGPTGQTDRRVFSEGSSTANNPLFTLGTDNTGLTPSATVFVRGDGGGNTAIAGRKSARTVFDDNWHHLVWTDSNGQGKLYVDGSLDETDYTYTRPAVTVNMTVIAGTARAPLPITPYTGGIDEVATWDRVLSWTEIQQIKTNGVPVPQGIVAPSISVQPPDRTNNVFAGDTITFPVVTGGTLPLDYQWRKNGSPISGVANPSALTDTLILTNVQVADSNTTYFVVVTNASGSVTSSVVRMYVKPWSPATNGEVLKADIGLTGQPNVQAGFDEFLLSANPMNFNNAVRLTISPIGVIALADRNRITGAMVANSASMTQAQLYNDFLFANSTTDGTGLRVGIERLGTNLWYGVTIWAFDPQSTGNRYADWTENSSGTPLPVTNSWTLGGNPMSITNNQTYYFDGAILPANDYQYTLGGLFKSSATGTLQFDAIKNGGTSFGAFINAIRLVAQPVGTRITRTELIAGNLQITVEGDYAGQPITLHENSTLVGGSWNPATGLTTLETRGPIVIFEVPASSDVMFYRAVSYLP
jgi:hypothetical protein